MCTTHALRTPNSALHSSAVPRAVLGARMGRRVHRAIRKRPQVAAVRTMNEALVRVVDQSHLVPHTDRATFVWQIFNGLFFSVDDFAIEFFLVADRARIDKDRDLGNLVRDLAKAFSAARKVRQYVVDAAQQVADEIVHLEELNAMVVGPNFENPFESRRVASGLHLVQQRDRGDRENGNEVGDRPAA